MGRRKLGVAVALSALAVFTTGWVRESALAVPTCFGRPATIVVPTLPNENREITGTSGDDVIVGGAGDDIIFGDLGDDRICARRGRDVVYGWEGNDSLSGARGWDRLYAEMGNDVLGGGAGLDVLAGGLGSDLMRGGPGTDTADFTQDNLQGPIVVDLGAGTATGASGSDVLGPGTIENVAMNCSAEQDDVLIGDDRPNGLTGGSGADVIRGNGGTDALYGGTPSQGPGDAILASTPPLSPTFCTFDDGPDQLFGGPDDDRLYGQMNDDFLDGEEGTDELDGGLGTDACRNGESLVACETQIGASNPVGVGDSVKLDPQSQLIGMPTNLELGSQRLIWPCEGRAEAASRVVDAELLGIEPYLRSEDAGLLPGVRGSA